MNGNIRAINHGSINGKKISNQDFTDAYKEVVLHRFVTSGKWPDEDRKSGFDPERDTYTWLLIIQKEEDLGVHVSDDAAAQFGRNIIRAFERIGVTSPQVFFQQVLNPRGFSIEDFERFVRHFVGIQELISTVGVAGEMITPDQAKMLYERDHQELTTDAVVFSATNFEANVQVTPEALGLFYTNMLATYRVPERLQVSYVQFPASNYLAQAQTQLTNLDQIVDVNYQRMGTNAFPEAATPAEAKAKLRDRILNQAALSLAKDKARTFANVLFDINPAKPENLKTLATSNNLPVQVSEPFERDSTPKGLDVGADFAKAAFAMTPEEPFSQAIEGRDAVYILALDHRLPPETPTLDQIKDKVTEDYKHMQARRNAYQAANTFVQTLTNGLASGKSFTNLCAEANVKPLKLPPFSISTRTLKEAEDLAPLNQIKQAAFSTSPGKPSPVIPTMEGAMLLFV